MNKKILLYEAFKAKSIVKTIGYLRKTINKDAVDEFISALNGLRNTFDVAIDKIDDQYLDYMSKRDAIMVNGKTENTDDYDDIYCLKFWFSTDSGYLGYTGTGNTEIPYNSNDAKFMRRNSPAPSLLNKIGISTGKVIPLNDDIDKFKELKTGDKIVGYFYESRRESRFGIATIFIETREDGRVFTYAIQSVSDGVNPESDDWQQYGDYAHTICVDNRVRDDNRDLSLYIDDGSPLTIDGTEVDDKADAPYRYNLPLDGSGDFTSWGNGDTMSIDSFDKADFAVLLYLNDLKKSGLKKPSDLKTYRELSRAGAASSLTDESIRQANLERYVAHIAKSLGITLDDVNLVNLQKLPLTLLCGKYSLVAIRTTNLDDYLSNLISYAYNLVSEFNDYKESGSDDNDSLVHYYKKFVTYFTKMKKNSPLLKYDKNFTDCMKYIDESSSENKEAVRDLFNTVIRIGERIQTHVSKDPINSLTHLKMFRYKLQSIRSISNTDEFSIDGRLDDWFDNLSSGSSKYAVSSTESLLDADSDRLNSYKENLNNLETYINSIV